MQIFTMLATIFAADVRPPLRLLALAIAWHGGTITMSAPMLAEVTGFSSRTVRRLLSVGEDAGYWTREYPVGGTPTTRLIVAAFR